MKHRRHATGRRVVATVAPWVALLVLLVSAIGIAQVLVSPSGNAAPTAFSSAPTVSGSVLVGTLSEATPISPEFWGVNVAATHKFGDTDAAYVAATPVTYVRFPGGTLGEEFNYTTGLLTADNGTTSQADASTTMFVTACETFSCHAILQLPSEIDSPSTAAYYADYVVHTLHFQPAYWEIGNDPSGWDHYGVPWPEWATNSGGNTTPAPFAQLVHSYIEAVLAVDPAGKFLALGAGMGGKDYSKPWVEDLASVDGHLLAGISVHSYIEGGPANPTDAQLFANLNGKYSLPAQVSADRQYILDGCSNCSQLQVFVTEINAAEFSAYNPLLPTFAGTLYLAADTVQGLVNQVTNLDWFAYQSHYSGSWSTGPEKWQMQYYLFSDLLTHLEDEVLPTTVTGPSTLYGVATYNDSGIALLLVNVNTTTAVQLDLSEAGFSPSSPLTQYLWVNGTPLPLKSQLPVGDSTILPPLSTEVLVGPSHSDSVSSYPVKFTETGLPFGSSWSATLNNTTRSSTSSTIGFSERNGTYPFSVQSPPGFTAAPLNGSVTVLGSGASVPIEFSANSTPAFETSFTETGLAAGTPWSVTLNGSLLGTTSNTVAFWEANGSYNFSVGGVPGFIAEPGSGSVVVDGSAVSVPLSFTSTTITYPATFSETGLVSGTAWSVTVGVASGQASAPLPIVVDLTNGTYAFTADPVQGYAPDPATGWVAILGVGTTVAVAYVASSPSDSDRITTVEGVATESNGSAVPGLGISLVFQGGTPPVVWLNLTTDSDGRFTASGLNLSGTLASVAVDSLEYQVSLTSVDWRSAGAVNVTVVLRTMPGSPSPGGFPFAYLPSLSFLNLVILGLSILAVTLVGAVVQAARRDRRLQRYRRYFSDLQR